MQELWKSNLDDKEKGCSEKSFPQQWSLARNLNQSTGDNLSGVWGIGVALQTENTIYKGSNFG